MTYYIYYIKNYKWRHLPNDIIGKIGCTSMDPHKRVKEQGYTSFELLETHDCPTKAGDRELELQVQYGVPVDNLHYTQSRKNRDKGTTKENCSKGGRAKRRHHGQKIVKIDVWTTHGDFVGTFNGIRDCGRKLKLRPGDISNVLRNRHGAKQHKGYKFKKVNGFSNVKF